MNWRRGFFRLWVIAAVLWAIAIVLILRPDRLIQDVFSSKVTVDFADKQATVEIPIPATDEDIRKAAIQLLEQQPSYTTRQHPESNATDSAKPLTVEGLKKIYVESLVKDYHDAMSAHEAQRRAATASLGWSAAMALVPPLFLLALGAALFWAFRGFRDQRR